MFDLRSNSIGVAATWLDNDFTQSNFEAIVYAPGLLLSSSAILKEV